MKVARIFEVDPKTISRISKEVVKLMQLDKNGTPHNTKRPLYSKYPAMDRNVMQFIRFARSQRLPVTLSQIKQRALLTSERENLSGFRASNGWVRNLLRRSSVQTSFRLHVQGSVSLPAMHEEQMAAFRQLCYEFALKSTWNMDESGLLYRMESRRTYLTREESRNDTRDALYQKHENRVTIVLAVNADTIHSLPVNYIGSSQFPYLLLSRTFQVSPMASRNRFTMVFRSTEERNWALAHDS